MATALEKGSIGDEVLRKEDRKFLLGNGRFVDDIHYPGELHAVFIRSPHAHADLVDIDISAASAMPGVNAILTGADMKADGIGEIPFMWVMNNSDGSPMNQPSRWGLARDRVRHVGEPVAVVIAKTAACAADAAEAVVVDYGPLPAVTESRAALTDAAPQLHAEAPGNKIYTCGRGDAAAADAAIASAAHVIELELVNNRIACAAIEARACLAVHDEKADRTTLYDATQAPHLIRKSITEALGIPQAKLRVVAPDVGGGFGTKGKHYPEETIVTWAARRLGRPVRWISSRSEAFMSDTQARDHLTTATLGLDADGKFVGLRVHTLANVGAYISTFGASIPGAIYSALLAGVYRTPDVYVEVTTVLTNTVPTDAYRGAGRPEACYVLERLADEAARRLGLDRAEIRRRNLIPVEAMPYTTPIGPTYDSGDFPNIMEKLLGGADWDGFAARRAESEARGRLRGIGLAMYVETSGVAPSKLAGMLGARIGFFESAEIRIDVEGGVRLLAGTHNHGQGHDTTYAQIISSKLGLPFENVTVIEGDTEAVPMGTGTFGSRSIAVGGSAIAVAADKIVEKGRKIAAHLLEAAEEDVNFADGVYAIAGTDRQMTIAEIATAANLGHVLPPGVEPGLNESAFYDPSNFAYSNGGHVVEIEIDRETGVIEFQRYHVVDDIGTVINPMIVHAQIHGGLAQGIGQAMTESAAYDPDSGQILAGSFLDYGMPRADDMPSFDLANNPVPTKLNPVGAKGAGEAGNVGALAVIMNAIVDALSPLGITNIDMPATPMKMWQAIRDARG